MFIATSGSVVRVLSAGLACGAAALIAAAAEDEKQLVFRAVDSGTGAPITNMHLKVQGSIGEKTFRRAPLLTDAEGKARIDYPNEATYLLIWTSRDGYPPHTIKWRPDRNDALPAEYVHKVPAGVTIGGIVQNAAGAAVPGATVDIRGPGIDANPEAREHLALWNHEEFSDENGKWQCSHVPADFGKLISITVRHFDYAPRIFFTEESRGKPTNTGVRIAELLSHTASFRIEPGLGVVGIVTDTDSKPIADAKVLLGSKFAREPDIQITDGEGRFTFRNVRPQPSETLTVQANGFAPELKTVVIGTNWAEHKIQLKPGNLLKGRVVDAEGQPVANARVSIEFWRGIQTLDWSARTDDEGRFAWDSAPPDPMRAYIGKTGYVQLRSLNFSGDGVEHTYTLKPTPVLRGKVVDAETDSPITTFRVTPGQSRGSFIDWSAYRTVQGRDGEFTISFSEAGRPVAKIEAEGYLPNVVDELDFAQETQLFRLKKGTGPEGVVLLPNGEPAKKAQVALKNSSTSLILGPGGFEERSHSRQMQVTRADDEGRFKLQADGEGTNIIAVHAEGYAMVSLASLDESRTITLQPFGRVEGVLRVGKRLGTNELLILSPKQNGPYDLHYSQDYRISTDEKGHFKFPPAPPGEHRIYRLIPFGERAHGYSHVTRFELAPGETKFVELGGTGRTVVGKAVSGAADLTIDWKADHHRLSTVLPRAPRRFEESQAWRNLPEIKAAYDNQRGYTLRFERDGSFAVEDVLPGEYQLRIDVRDRAGGGLASRAESIASMTKMVTVPALPAGGADEPWDLGVLEVAPKPQLKTGQRAPLFEVPTIDGKTVRLADYRGKYVLLDFWATWCGPCVAELPHLKAAYEKFGADDRFMMIGLSLDDAMDAPKKFVTKNGVGWPQGFLGEWSKTQLPSQYGVSGIPAAFLIGPDGKVIAQGLRGEGVASAIATALAKK